MSFGDSPPLDADRIERLLLMMPNSTSASPIAEIEALRALVSGTARLTGEPFFQSLVRRLAEALQVEHAFVAEFVERPVRVRTLAWWAQDKFADNIEFDLDGTPCQEVYSRGLCHYSDGVQSRFPRDAGLIDLGIQSYLGVPLLDVAGEPLGHLVVFDPRPMSAEPRFLFTFEFCAARAAAELERLRSEKLLRDSEQRYRDLYNEAPIAYVHEDLESRFISANRAALKILGITPEEVPGTVGMSFIPDTPEAQHRVKEAFESVGGGADTSGVVLELRRKDNGKPIWIQWWSKPDLDGKSTRTMFVDITDRVLAEQEKARLQQQNIYLQEEIKAVHNFEEIIGQSPALSSVLKNVNRVAATDTTVLITGETGTGKELIARAIHSTGKRKNNQLPEQYRTVLVMRDIDGFDTDESARLLDINTGAVKTRLHRARQALRTLLAPHFESPEASARSTMADSD